MNQVAQRAGTAGGVLAATCISTLVVNANTSAVSILLPAISEDTGMSLNTLQWAVTGYSLVGAAVKSFNGWLAYATVTIRDISTGAVVANATVNGSFSPGGTASCVTGSAGSCTMSSARIKANTGSTVITVTNVSGTNLSYDSSQNSVTQITIVKP